MNLMRFWMSATSRGQRGLAQLDARAGFVDQIDGLVRQEAVRNEAAGGEDGGFDRIVGVGDGVELLVALLDAEQDLDGIGFVRRRHLHGLEAALERAVLLDRLAEFGRRGGADALDLAARQRRLQDVGGVERAFGRTGAHQRVQLVDEDDGVLILHQLLHDGLQALFELAAVLGAGDDQREVERQDALVGQEDWARRHRRCAAPGLRRWPSCRRPARRSAPGCSWCGGTGSGPRARVRSRGRSADRACRPWRPASGRG